MNLHKTITSISIGLTIQIQDKILKVHIIIKIRESGKITPSSITISIKRLFISLRVHSLLGINTTVLVLNQGSECRGVTPVLVIRRKESSQYDVVWLLDILQRTTGRRITMDL